MATQQLDALRAALELQRRYEAENWPFVDEENKPTGTGESITYHLASLYQWSPEYVLTLPEQERNERLKEIWRSFVIAGDIIKRYEDATTALLQEQEKPEPSYLDDPTRVEPGWLGETYYEPAQKVVEYNRQMDDGE